ncbi:MAG: DTW domain-containing protein [Colwellia sp.]
MHAVHQLFQYRKSLSTTTYKSRGQRVVRCELCRLAKSFCICEHAPLAITANEKAISSNAGFLLLMYDTEVLKPSNTGKLIADLIPDTYAFLWSRTEKNDELQAVLDDEQWQPFVVFPQEYAQQERVVQNKAITCSSDKRPLFIMLDGSWREAKKMFRKSPYLNDFPLVSFDPNVMFSHHDYSPVGAESRYTVRKTELEHQFSTAEIAARVLDMFGEHDNANVLDLWFDVFNYQYQKSVCQRNKGDPDAMKNYQKAIEAYFTGEN